MSGQENPVCDECGIIFDSKYKFEEHINGKHSIKKLPADKEDDLNVVEPKVKIEEYNDFTKTTHDEEEPKLITIRGTSNDFLEARWRLVKIITRGALYKKHVKVNNTSFKVTNVQNKVCSTEVDIETLDKDNEKGKTKLTIYKDNKKKNGKKDQTIMISKKAKNDAKHVQILSANIIQYLLEGFITKKVSEEDIIWNEIKSLNNTSFTCEVCAKKFPTKQGCSLHNIKVHKKTVKFAFPCELCGEVRSTKETLKAHVEHTHEKSKMKRSLSEMKDVKEFLCTECKESFTDKNKYNNHMTIHSTSQPLTKFICTECKESFKVKNEFDNHMTIHSTSPPPKKIKNDQQQNDVEALMDAEPTFEEPEDEEMLEAPEAKIQEKNQ